MTHISINNIDGHTVTGSYEKLKNAIGSCLLIHGITADRHEWGFFDALVWELSEKRISTLAIDYRGHGESNFSMKQLSLSGIYSDISLAWQWLAQNESSKERCIIGNSFGAGVAYLFGQLQRDVSQIVLTCPVTSYLADLQRVNPHWRNDVLTKNLQYASKELNPAIISEMEAYDHMIRCIKPSIYGHIVHGTADSDVPLSEVKSFAAARSPVFSLHPLLGMDHSFAAPDGTFDRENKSIEFRAQAAKYVAQLISANFDAHT
jgi:predicted alpha/beta-fold hydrolase